MVVVRLPPSGFQVKRIGGACSPALCSTSGVAASVARLLRLEPSVALTS